MSNEIIRVLIVDDITETRESIKRMLQFDQDIEVIGTARTGREAIEQAQQMKPDVIIMDINMPDMDGITATEAIRRKHPYAQVIILSVQNDPNYMRRAMRVGAHDFLPKPPMIDELTGAIRQAGEVARTEREKAEQEAARTGSLVAQGAASTQAKGDIFVVYGPKGGVGSTMIATNLAIALSMAVKESKVALVDGSMQFGDVPIFLSEQTRNSIIELAPRVDELDPNIIEDVMTKHKGSNIHILASPPRPEMAEKVTGEQFGKLLTYLARIYDYVVVDTSSHLTETTLNALEVATLTVLITTQDIPSIKNSNLFLTLADALGFHRDQILFIMNRYDKRVGITPERVGESLRQQISLAIPFDEKTAVSDSIKRGVPLIMDNRSHPVAKGIIHLQHILREKITKLEENVTEPGY
jgi:pilus assembly protein CpaE